MDTHRQSVAFRSRSLSQAGFTLVEIMVGLLIGMLATLVVMQVFSVFEVQKRTTTGNADAQINGSIALFTLANELQMSGYSLIPTSNTDSPLKCATLMINGVLDASVPNRLTPVAITDGVSDQITIRYGDSLMGGAPAVIQTRGGAPNEVIVDNSFGCKKNDATLMSNAAWCFMSVASDVVVDPPTITLGNMAGVAANVNLACLGNWHEVTYRVNNNNLERQDLAVSPAFVPSVAGIVNVQAQYGISATSASNLITGWVDATGIWAAPTLVTRNRIRAIRVAVVARTDKLETNVVSTPCSSLTAPAPTGVCAWEGSAGSPAPNIDLSAIPNWDHYRYRVFESIYPLRSMVWTASAGAL